MITNQKSDYVNQCTKDGRLNKKNKTSSDRRSVPDRAADRLKILIAINRAIKNFNRD